MDFIDVHTHGIKGRDVHEADPESILEIARLHGAAATSAVILAVSPSSVEGMRNDMAAVRDAMRAQRKNDGAEILGVHLEGPFLNPGQAGALDKKSFLPATVDNWERLIEGFDSIVRIITVAPEIEGALKLIKIISDRGIVVSMGHSEATYADAEAGFHAGARGITHIFNAMRGFHHREPGIAGFGLASPHVYTEVIADPYHLHLETIRLIFSIKPPDRIVLVSDSVRGTAAGDNCRGVTDAAGRLLGGSMALAGAMERLIGLGFDRHSIELAASKNPARYVQM